MDMWGWGVGHQLTEPSREQGLTFHLVDHCCPLEISNQGESFPPDGFFKRRIGSVVY